MQQQNNNGKTNRKKQRKGERESKKQNTIRSLKEHGHENMGQMTWPQTNITTRTELGTTCKVKHAKTRK